MFKYIALISFLFVGAGPVSSNAVQGFAEACYASAGCMGNAFLHNVTISSCLRSGGVSYYGSDGACHTF